MPAPFILMGGKIVAKKVAGGIVKKIAKKHAKEIGKEIGKDMVKKFSRKLMENQHNWATARDAKTAHFFKGSVMQEEMCKILHRRKQNREASKIMMNFMLNRL